MLSGLTLSRLGFIFFWGLNGLRTLAALRFSSAISELDFAFLAAGNLVRVGSAGGDRGGTGGAEGDERALRLRKRNGKERVDEVGDVSRSGEVGDGGQATQMVSLMPATLRGTKLPSTVVRSPGKTGEVGEGMLFWEKDLVKRMVKVMITFILTRS